MDMNGDFRQRRYLSSFKTDDGNILNMKSPLLALAWSFTFPGFGHYYVGKIFLGLILIAWEFVLNSLAHLNLCIYYSLLGDFETAKRMANLRWFVCYGVVYIFCMWDSYYRAVETNHVYLATYKEDKRPSVFTISPAGVNYQTKKNPWIATVWGLMMPGLNAVYTHKIVTALYAIIWISIVGYKSGLFIGILYSFWGNYDLVKNLTDPQWLMFLPSLYAFMGYEGYAQSIEINRFIKYEMTYFLRDNYQNQEFKMPI